MSGNALTHVSNKGGSSCFFFKLQENEIMKIELISVGCNCLVHKIFEHFCRKISKSWAIKSF